MAAPFGRAPTFDQYRAWLIECGGACRALDLDGEPAFELISAEGLAVIIDVDADERLVPTMISYLDRTLAIVSPWHVER